jgi:4-hydroxy-L-threonine phosphate dehydrogenase PdxA
MDHTACKPRLALTMGDPAGIGPEIVAKVCTDQEILDLCDLVVVGRRMIFSAGCLSAGIVPPQVDLVEAGVGAEITPGVPSKEGGGQSARFIEKAAQMCLDGKVQAMVTAPISKYSLQLAGVKETGHTTMLARITKTETPVMMLAGSKLKVVLATIHCAYREVLDRLSEVRSSRWGPSPTGICRPISGWSVPA